MGGKIEGSSMNLQGRPTVTIVFGQWHKGEPEHIIGLFFDEARAKEVEAEEKAIDAQVRNPRFNVWTRTFFVQ